METPENKLPFHERVRLIRIQTLFTNARGNPWAWTLAAFCSATLLRDAGVPERGLALWMAGVVVMCVVMVFLEQRTMRLDPGDLLVTERLFRARVAVGCVLAALFGSAVFFLPA